MTLRILISFILLFQLQSLTVLSQNTQKVQTGEFEIISTARQILGDETASAYGAILGANEKIKWSIYVPEDYDPTKPAGILVHLIDKKLPKIPFGWTNTLNAKNLIWISLNKVGRLKQDKEILLTVLATPFLQSQYNINADRIYLMSTAGSCFPASGAAQIYSSIFKGTIYSTCEMINWKKNIPSEIEVMKQNRFVFISSAEKELQRIMRSAERRYNKNGILKTEYFNVPDLVYGQTIKRRRLAKAIDMLDRLD